MRATLFRRFSALALVLGFTCACTNVPVRQMPGVVTLEGSDPRILVHDGAGVAMMAAVSGELIYNPSTKCLVIEVPGKSSSPVVPVWPPGTHPTTKGGKRGVISKSSGLELLAGVEVRLGGGSVDWINHPPRDLKIPNACVADSSASTIFKVSQIQLVG